MPAIRFDGAGDGITVGLGSTVATAPHTLVVVSRRFNTGNWHSQISGEGASAGTVRASMELTNGDKVGWSTSVGSGDGTATTQVPDPTDLGSSPYEWYGEAVAKSAGSGTVLVARRNLTGAASIASETVSPSASVSASAATKIIFGLWDGTDDFNGWMAAAAWFNGALTLSQITECFAGKKTSDIWNCSFGRPAALWQFNVAPSSVVDLTGNGANYVSSVGASLDAAETPNWTYDGTGVPPADDSTKPGTRGEFSPQLVGRAWF